MLRRRPPATRLAAAALAATVAAAILAVPGSGAAGAAGSAPPAPGDIAALAGTGGSGWRGDGGPATSAWLDGPRAVAFDQAGDAYIADAVNDVIRRIDPAGTITTVAGLHGAPGFSGDGGPATAAQLNTPHGVAVDAAGDLLISDSVNNRVREVDAATGIITTVAGDGAITNTGDGPALTVSLSDPKTLFMAPGDQLYIAETNGNRIRRLDVAAGTLDTVAGSGTAGFSGDGGPATAAELNQPKGVWVTPALDVYIADEGNQVVRRVDHASGTISTVAGSAGTAGYNGDDRAAGDALLNKPRAVAVDPAGVLYIGEEGGQRVRRVDPATGIITTIVGTGVPSADGYHDGDGGPAACATLYNLRGLMLDRSGRYLYIADALDNKVRVVDLSTPAGGPGGPCPTPVTTTTTTTTTTQAPAAPDGASGPGPAFGTASDGGGYWTLGEDGVVHGFGTAVNDGDPSNQLEPGAHAEAISPTPSGRGYRVTDDHGRVFGFGDAAGPTTPPVSLRAGESVTSLSATPSGRGYWLFTTDGRVLPAGDALDHGDMSRVVLNAPVLASVATPSGNGYYMVASDGGIFAFGDARFYGSMGGRPLNAPIRSLVPTADGAGYWLVGADGGIFAFGDAAFRGSMGAVRLNQPVRGMVRYGDGYLMIAADGGVFDFSDRPFSGSLAGRALPRPVVAIAASS